ncbi:MAG: folate-binding protein YgfZ [Burkholderiales bacterium]|nr:folate-binding protein YgfZ [Burkholderiales bacterium]
MTAVTLPQYALLRFSGADAQSFLHGQLTCDVQALKSGRSSYGGYCTPKGRLLATFLLSADDTGYTMLLPAALAEAMRKRLSMYILRAKVKAEITDDALAGVSGEGAAADITNLGGAMPASPHTVVDTAAAVRTIKLPYDRYLLVLPRASAGGIAAAGSGHWERLDIAAGIPFIVPATQEQFVPQMVNLDLIGALSYSKGCYPGQEIVARTHYLGKLKQRMFRAKLDAPAAAGDKLYCVELGDQAAGMIVTAAAAGTGHEVLAVLQTAYAHSSRYHLGSLQGPQLDLLDLPYAVT